MRSVLQVDEKVVQGLPRTDSVHFASAILTPDSGLPLKPQVRWYWPVNWRQVRLLYALVQERMPGVPTHDSLESILWIFDPEISHDLLNPWCGRRL